MEWSDEAIVLSARRHGEAAAIVSLLTRDHGRHLGLVPGGAGRRARGVYEPGNRVQASWRARLSEHLGHYACELLASRAASLLDDELRLGALSAAVAVVDASLPERQPHGRIYDALDGLIETLCRAGEARWPERYVRFEIDLLADLGFGLDLARCAATGASAELIYVSPKTGRAVSRAAGKPYCDRLLPLPPFLRPASSGDPAAEADVLAGLRLAGHFLAAHAFSHRDDQRERRGLEGHQPAARERFVARLQRRATAPADRS